jgi:hypothetical protein
MTRVEQAFRPAVTNRKNAGNMEETCGLQPLRCFAVGADDAYLSG